MQVVGKPGSGVGWYEPLSRHATEVHSGQGVADLPDGELLTRPVDLVLQNPHYQQQEEAGQKVRPYPVIPLQRRDK